MQPIVKADLTPKSVCQRVERARRAGRPVWPISPGVPRLDRVLAIQSREWKPSYCLVSPAPSDPAAVIAPEALAALESDSKTLRDRANEKPHAAAQLRSLEMAAVRDLLNESYEELAEAVGYKDATSARRAVHQGRHRWMRLGAWPWTYFRDKGRPHDDWQSDGYLADALEAWETNQPITGRIALSLRPRATRP